MNSTTNLSWIRWMATLSSLIAIGGLLALLVENSYALDPPGGFRPGAKSFNPYSAGGVNAASGNAPSPFFEDDEEEDFDMDSGGGFQENPPMANANSGAPRQKKSARAGIQVGGGDKGVVEAGRSVNQAAALVDNEGAKGSNEVITDFNFPDADILDIAKALGKLTGKNFILDKDVKGRITIISNSPVTVRDAWRAFLTALDMNGFALIPSGNFIRIARQRDARDKQLKTYTGSFSPDSDALITRLFSLKYLSAEEVARNFRSFMPANSRIIPYEQTNTVIVTDTGSNISKLSKLLEILDVEGYDAGIEVIPVKFASAVELAKLIDSLIPGTSTNSVGGPRFPTAGGSRFTARKTKEGGVINTIIADERTNNLIVHANSKGADQVRELITKLDKKLPAAMGGGKVHVMYLQFADAEAISTTLSNLTQSSGPSSRPPSRSGGGSSIGSNPLADTASLFEGQIKIAADKSTNSLVITASPTDFSTVQRVINRLDIPRDQVFAEVVIMELQMGKNFTFSANVLSPVSGLGSLPSADLANFITNPLASTGAIIGFRTGGSKTVDIGGKSVTVGNVQGLIKALQTNNNANVVATPQILTMDNVEASFTSAEKIPVKSSVAANGGVGTSITRENVEISIKMKPQINKMSNYVKLDIDAKLEDFSGRVLPDNVASEALALLSRQAKTTVTVANGDTVVLGGLTRDTAQEKTSKVPILGDIPVLGWLFRSKSSETAKSNLLIFITPTIIRQPAEVRAILDRKLKERDDFIEGTAGGYDPARSYRDDIIRKLPDSNTLDKRPQANYTIDSGIPAGGGGSSSSGSSAAPSGNEFNEGPGSFQPGVGLPDGVPPNGGFDGGSDLPPPPMGDFEG